MGGHELGDSFSDAVLDCGRVDAVDDVDAAPPMLCDLDHVWSTCVVGDGQHWLPSTEAKRGREAGPPDKGHQFCLVAKVLGAEPLVRFANLAEATAGVLVQLAGAVLPLQPVLNVSLQGVDELAHASFPR
ncbi:MAG: hypothetical protein ACYTFQ_31200 [Planctomycetota bacterium]